MTVTASPTLSQLWRDFRQAERQERTAERRFGFTAARGQAGPGTSAAAEAIVLRGIAGAYYDKLAGLVVGHDGYGPDAVAALEEFLAAEATYTADLRAYALTRAFQKAAQGPPAGHTAKIEAARLRLETARGRLEETQRRLDSLTGILVASVI